MGHVSRDEILRKNKKRNARGQKHYTIKKLVFGGL